MAFRQSKDFVASLEKGLDVLTCFNRQNAKLTLSEVARLTGSSPASARRSLLTLHALDFLESDGRRFWLGPRVLLVAHAYLASRPTPQLAQPLLDALSERTRQSASLGKLQDDDVIIIARSTARRSLSTGLGIGSRLVGSSGHISGPWNRFLPFHRWSSWACPQRTCMPPSV